MKAIHMGGKFLGAVLVVMGLLVFAFGTAAQTTGSFWDDSARPAFVKGNDSQSVELGMKFTSSAATSITAIRFYKATNSRGTHTGTIWTSTGIKLASVTFVNETSSGWQTQQLAAPLAISAGSTYVVSYHTVQYAWSSPFFTQPLTVGSLTAPVNAGVYTYGSSVRFPTSTWKASNYWVDVVVQPSVATETEPPTSTEEPPTTTQTDETTPRWRRTRHSRHRRSTADESASVIAPTIASQPVSRTVTAGQSASFSVSVTGTAPFAYQWKKNGATINGATSSSYDMANVTMSDNGAQFSCTVGNSAGSVTSNAASLTVTSAAVAPAITSQPANRTVIAGQSASFSVSATGTAPFTYQWMKNGAAINGATSSSYTTPSTVAADNGAQFTVLVSNATGNVTSNPATLTVGAATLLLSANPSSLSFGSVDLGSSSTKQITFTNAGTGNITLSGMSLSGAGFTASGISNGQVLTPGQKATVNVSFQPAAAGSLSGQVTVSSTASPVVVNLSGSGAQQVSHSVSLTWTRSTSTVSGYLVYSSQVSGGPYTKLTASAVNLPAYTDSSVQNGKTYYYVVTAVNASGMESTYSNQASALIQ